MTDTIRVVVADDQPLVRTGLVTILEAQPDITVIAETSTGTETIDAVLKHQPDVVLMDIRMPTLNGVEATRRICEQQPAGSTRVLILTVFDLDEYVFNSLRAGASGFLLKDAGRAQIVNAVRVIARGDGLLDPAVTGRVIRAFAGRSNFLADDPTPQSDLDAHPALATLTDREHEVLMLVARGLSNAEVGAELFVAEGTVKTHVSSILSKLGVRDRIQAVILAHQAGLTSPGSDDLDPSNARVNGSRPSRNHPHQPQTASRPASSPRQAAGSHNPSRPTPESPARRR